MIQTLGPREILALLADPTLDVVDVRDPRDWAAGHVPGARSLPLEELRADPRLATQATRALFVCARGLRSLTAARLVEAAGVAEVYSLDGGMLDWVAAGLPVESAGAPPSARPEPPAPAALPDPAPESKPASPATAPSFVALATPAASDATCGLPSPGLEAAVGENLKALRSARNLSLDHLAQLTGLSRTLLGQIELGKTSPSVSVVWRLARAFDVPFSALLATQPAPDTVVLRASEARRISGPDARFTSRALYPPGSSPDAEFYELCLAPYSREDAQAHQTGTRENLIVVSGRLQLIVAGTEYELARGDAIVFGADVPHSYVNPDKSECWMYLVMTYARRDVAPVG